MVSQPLHDELVALLTDYHRDDECIYGADHPAGWSHCGDPSCRYCRGRVLLAVVELWPELDPDGPVDQSLVRFQQIARRWGMLPAQLSRAVCDVRRGTGPGREVGQ